MALALENSQLVWKKVKNALANSNPATQAAFKGLKEYLSTQGRNPDLQFVAYSELEADDNDGTGLLDAACTIYAFYAKHESGSSTAATTKLFQSATVDTNAALQALSLDTAAANQETFQIYPTGWEQVDLVHSGI